VNAGICLTFFNEDTDAFPEWLDPAWHNCLIGCMICQDVCPANKEQTSWVMPGGEFSEEETTMILDGASKKELSSLTTAKLQKVKMLESFDVLARNLRLLIDKEQKRAH
jgi:epoxyqueuosine reductase